MCSADNLTDEPSDVKCAVTNRLEKHTTQIKYHSFNHYQHYRARV